MERCDGQLPFVVGVDHHGEVGGPTAEDACAAVWDVPGHQSEWEPMPPICYITSPTASYPSSVRQVCDPEDEKTITCTTEKPCVMQLTKEQMDTVDSWLFVFVVVAMVFAVLHGFSQGQKL